MHAMSLLRVCFNRRSFPEKFFTKVLCFFQKVE